MRLSDLNMFVIFQLIVAVAAVADVVAVVVGAAADDLTATSLSQSLRHSAKRSVAEGS